MENNKTSETTAEAKNETVDNQTEQGDHLFSTKLNTELISQEIIETYPMYITNPIWKVGMKKYVLYTLTGSVLDNREIPRRFSDFYSLREKWKQHWPGIFIPNIPPKKAYGNWDGKIIEVRLRLLNFFLLKLTKFKYWYESEAVKLFQSDEIDVSRSIDKIPELTYDQILINYRETFTDYYEAYDVILGRVKLSEFNSFLKKILVNITNFKYTVDTTISKKAEDFMDYISLMHTFQEYEKYTLLDSANNDESKWIFFNPHNTILSEKILKLHEKLINPYVHLLEWWEKEESDIEGMIDSLNSLNSLNDSYEELCKKCDLIDANMKSLQFGQKGMLSMFSFKNKDSAWSAMERDKKDTEEQISTLHNIIKIASFNMECYLEQFQNEKMNDYYRHVKTFALIQRDNVRHQEDLWNCVKEDSNIVEFRNRY